MNDIPKEVIKEAFKEWLDDKYAAFGKWTLKSVAYAVFGYLITFLIMHGWNPFKG